MILTAFAQFQIGNDALEDGDKDAGCAEDGVRIRIGESNACDKADDGRDDNEGDVTFVEEGAVFHMGHLM